MTEASQIAIWVTAAQGGNQLALTKLLTACHRRLRARAAARLPAAMKAKRGPEDILQEVYLDVFRQINRFEDRGPGSFLNWLYAILDRKLAAARRAAHYQMRDIDREVTIGTPAADSYWDLLDQLYADSGTPSRVVRREEVLRALSACITDLSEPERTELEQAHYVRKGGDLVWLEPGGGVRRERASKLYYIQTRRGVFRVSRITHEVVEV